MPRRHCLALIACLGLASLSVSGCPGQRAERLSGIDLFGDALPPGAITRLGTRRLCHLSPVSALAFSLSRFSNQEMNATIIPP
jgi:hypothetical protein